MKARLTPEADLDAQQVIQWYNEFPYEIMFEMEDDEIIIYAIYHCARDPEVWKRRRDT